MSDRLLFLTLVHESLAKTPIPARLAHKDAVVLERIARGAGQSKWYYCDGLAGLGAIESALSPGSWVSFYFDDRIRKGVFSEATRNELEVLIAEQSNGGPNDAIAGWLREDGFRISLIVPIYNSEVEEYEREFSSAPIFFIGVYPSADNDGFNAVSLVLPDADGVTRSHPY